MNGYAITLLVFAGLAIICLTVHFGLIYLIRLGLRAKYSVFGTDFLVEPTWNERSGIKPAKGRGRSQTVFLVVDGYKFNMGDTLDITLPDGRTVVPEVQVVDSSGEIFDTEDGVRFGSSIGLRVLPNGESHLSYDKENSVIRIRSDKPFRCRSIGWMTKRMK